MDPKVTKLDSTIQMDQPALTAMFNDMVTAGSDAMDFHMHREPEPGRTFSADGFNDLMHSLRLFVGARIQARFTDLPEGEPGPTDIHVLVKVVLDGETFEVPVEVKPWYATDGSRRQTAVGPDFVNEVLADYQNRSQ